MKDKSVKLVAVGIIFLFIGSSFLPGITADDAEVLGIVDEIEVNNIRI